MAIVKVPQQLWRGDWMLVPLAWVVQIVFYFNGTFHKGAHAPLLGDGYILHTMALNYLQNGVMAYREAVPTLTQLPVYPWMIANVYRIFGEDPRAMIWIQMILAGMSIPFLMHLLKPLLGTWRWAFALLWVMDIHQITYAGVISTEFWVVHLWVLAWIFLWKAMQEEGFWKWILAALCLSLAANIKPLSLYLPFFLTPLLLALTQSPWIDRIKRVVVFLLIYLLCLLPLLIRNHEQTGEFPRYTTISSFNLWYFNLPYFRALDEGISVAEARHAFVEKMRLRLIEKGADLPPITVQTASDRHAHRAALGLNEHDYAKLADTLSSEYLKDHFWDYVRWHLHHSPNIFLVSNLSWIKLVYQYFEPFSMGWNPSEWLKLILKGGKESFFAICRLWELTYSLGFLGLGLLGFLRFRLLSNPRFFLFTWSFPLYVTLICGVNVWGRFRYLFMPMLICIGLMALMTLRKNNGSLPTGESEHPSQDPSCHSPESP